MAKKLGPGPTHNANAGLRQGLQLLLAIGSVGFYGRSLTLLITPLGEDGYDEVADKHNDKEEHSGSLYSLSFGYGEETTEGMELRDSEVIVV